MPRPTSRSPCGDGRSPAPAATATPCTPPGPCRSGSRSRTPALREPAVSRPQPGHHRWTPRRGCRGPPPRPVCRPRRRPRPGSPPPAGPGPTAGRPGGSRWSCDIPPWRGGPSSRDRSSLSRAELRNPPRRYYQRVALGTVLPGAGLLGTRWQVLSLVLVAVALAVGGFLVVQLARGGVVRSVLDVAVRPEVLRWLGVVLMVGAVVWIGSIVLTAQQSWPGSRGRRGVQVAFAVVACVLRAPPSAPPVG